MRNESKTWNRKGMTFVNASCTEDFDLSHIRYLHSGIDTLKQLFNCMPRADLIFDLEQMKASKVRPVINIGGIDWFFTRSSKQSGFQYIFKNLDEGFVVMFKSFFTDSNLSGTHLKIEVTPQKLYQSLGHEELTKELQHIASLFAYQIVENGVAAHLAVDLKGFEIPKDFEQHLVARSKRQYKAKGISEAQFSLNEIAAVYGEGETFTFGQAGGLQFCLYDKTLESIKSDKIGFWESLWSRVPAIEDPIESEYQKGDVVKRLEMRFHHSIIREFCNDSTNTATDKKSLVINNYSDLVAHMDGLWLYALKSFRYQHSSSYIHPVWQFLMEDISFFAPAPNWFYKRAAKDPSPSSKRNVAFFLGNMLKLMARRRFSVDFAVSHVMSSGLEEELAVYFGCHTFDGMGELHMHLTEFISGRFQEHAINGVAA